MSLTNLPCVLWSSVWRVPQWISSGFGDIIFYLLFWFMKYPTILIRTNLRVSSIDITGSGEKRCYRGTKARAGPRQVSSVSSRFELCAGPQRWDFLLGYNTTNWACFSWISEAIEGHHSSFPFWFKWKRKKEKKKRHSSRYWATHSEINF